MNEIETSSKAIEVVIQELKDEIRGSIYYLNPDNALVRDLIKGLLINEGRYGYRACPCRLVYGPLEENTDIICPCDYRDDDMSDYDTCYCGLYVSEKVNSGEECVKQIPERRLPYKNRIQKRKNHASVTLKNDTKQKMQELFSLPYPVWRCRVCGYLAARETSPGTCPICKAKDRFERFL